MLFRPCIDLHQGVVKQIVGSTLKDGHQSSLLTNFEAQKSPSWYALRYRQDRLRGGHIIRLGPGNTAAAKAALKSWPGGMQLGGGISVENAANWIDAGAAAVIVTSWVFHDGFMDDRRLAQLVGRIGKDKLVLDLSCRRKGDDYYIVTDRWQTLTQEKITQRLLQRLSKSCVEFLIHAADVEGKCRGIETSLVEELGRWQGAPITYAGGIATLEDIEKIAELGRGCIDFTVGSALDMFGGSGLKYKDMVRKFGPQEEAAMPLSS